MIVGAGRCGLQMARSMREASVPLVAVVEPDESARRAARRWLPGVPVLGSDRRSAGGLGRARGRTRRLVEIGAPPGSRAGWVGRCGWCFTLQALCPPRSLRRCAHDGGVSEPAPADGVLSGRWPTPAPGRSAAAVEGEPRAVREAMALARRLGMRGFRLAAEAKPRYHAAAAVAANLTYTLVASACEELATIGPSRRWAAKALRPLVLEAVTAALGRRRFLRAHRSSRPGRRWRPCAATWGRFRVIWPGRTPRLPFWPSEVWRPGTQSARRLRWRLPPR